MVNTTPTKRSQHSSKEVSNAVHSREEWISSFLLKAALRPRLRSLPVVWMIIVSAVVFPIGWWSQLDSVGKADEVAAVNSDQNTQEATQSAQNDTENATDSAAQDAPEREPSITIPFPTTPEPVVRYSRSPRARQKLSLPDDKGAARGRPDRNDIPSAPGQTKHESLRRDETGNHLSATAVAVLQRQE